MFYGFQCSWLSILLMGSIALACFLCWVRIFNIICYILLYITLEVLMTFKCNFVTCNILFHLVLMIGLIYRIEWFWIRFKKNILLRIYHYGSANLMINDWCVWIQCHEFEMQRTINSVNNSLVKNHKPKQTQAIYVFSLIVDN